MSTTTFAQKSFLLTAPKNSAAQFELMKRPNKKIDRQTEKWPIEKRGPGLHEM